MCTESKKKKHQLPAFSFTSLLSPVAKRIGLFRSGDTNAGLNKPGPSLPSRNRSLSFLWSFKAIKPVSIITTWQRAED